MDDFRAKASQRDYRGTSKETPTPLGPPLVPRHKATVASYGGGLFIMSEVTM